LFAKGLYSEGCNAAAAAAGLKAAAEPTSGPSLEQDNRHILIISSIGHKEDLPPGRRRRHHHHRADLCALQLMLLKILLFLSLGGLFEICMWWASVCLFACKQQTWKKLTERLTHERITEQFGSVVARQKIGSMRSAHTCK
jgi:hypothetical protein